VALINQQTKTSQGNINPNLYALASLSSDAFHDITTGSNQVPCKAGTPDCPVGGGVIGYVAGTGYDQVTGLGSVDAANLVNEWGSDFQVTISPATLTLNAGQSSTATVNVTSVGNFTGTVSFTCTVAATLTNTTCSVPGTVSHSGSTTLTLTNASAARSSVRWLPLGGRGPDAPLFWTFTVGSLLFLVTATALFPKRRYRTLLVTAAALLVITTVSCGDGNNSSSSSNEPPPESGIVTVTATSGVESHTATLTVTIP
jgi:hypothetical protein